MRLFATIELSDEMKKQVASHLYGIVKLCNMIPLEADKSGIQLDMIKDGIWKISRI